MSEQIQRDHERAAPETASTAGADNPRERLLCLLHENALQAADMAAQLAYLGYRVAVAADWEQLQDCIVTHAPSAVLLDLAFPDGVLAGAARLAQLRQTCSHRFEAVFMSGQASFKTRLAAARAGAAGYFCKPLDMVALAERLDELASGEEERPFRLLVITDDGATAGPHVTVLREAGMDVRVLHRLADMLHVLDQHRPELILMDVHLPECDGVDLARLIRQDAAYLDVPILFLSGQSGIERQLDVIASGADGFLVKPIATAHLLFAVRNRARRYRDLRGLIMRDSLTGLLNHSAIKEQLSREIARARRAPATLALAMIDIDHFKRVNDTHGHPAGDQVIRALSRLLQQRLRRGDLIGRYGGEEFVVVMPETSTESATAVLEKIRVSFAGIRHQAASKEFTVSFSGGVAQLDADSDADALFHRADQALYRAKHGGRNRIETG